MGNFAPVNIFDALYTVQSIEGTVVDVRNGSSHLHPTHIQC